MRRSTDRIYTTHVGSLARPAGLLDLMKAAAGGQAVELGLAAAQQAAVAEVVGRQRAAGIDVISDGEQGKSGFFTYIWQRLSGYEPRPGPGPLDTFRAEVDEFPEYYEQYFRRAMTGGMVVPATSVTCTGPVSYVGQERIGRDLTALRAAVRDAGPDEVFVCAVRVRLHTCYGINEGPRVHDAPGERRRQRRLRVLLPSDVQPRDPPEDRVGQVRGARRRLPASHRTPLVSGITR